MRLPRLPHAIQSGTIKPLFIAAVVDEECDSIGTEALLKRYTADKVIVIEPTDLRLTIAHKGYAWFEIVTHGRAAHGSLPSEGRDAIRMMGRVLNILDALDRKLASLTPHPLLGHWFASIASLIHGGQELFELSRGVLSAARAPNAARRIRWRVPEANCAALIAGAFQARDPDFRATVRGLGSRPAYESRAGRADRTTRQRCDSRIPCGQAPPSSSSEWRHGLTQHFSPKPAFLESFSVPADEGSTGKRSTWSWIPSFNAARFCSKQSDSACGRFRPSANASQNPVLLAFKSVTFSPH